MGATPLHGAPPTLSPTAIGAAWHLPALAHFIPVVVPVVGVAVIVYFWLQLRRSPAGASAAGLNYVVGPMGSGKSMYGVRAIVDAVTTGRYAVTNVRLHDGWATTVARKCFPRDRGERRATRAAWLLGFYVYETSLDQAMRYRVPCAQCGGNVRDCGHSGPFQEGRAVVVWDESHNDLNNRDYQGHGADASQRGIEKERRRKILRWATQLRKLGYCGFLLSQHAENTDAQLRRVCNHIIRLQNQRQRGIGRMLPRRLTMFLVYWYPANLAETVAKLPPVKFERYLLPWFRHLYDSWETFAGLDDELDEDGGPIFLPAGGIRPVAGVPDVSGSADGLEPGQELDDAPVEGSDVPAPGILAAL